MNSRSTAKFTGWSLILMALVAGFSLGYAYQDFYGSDDAETVRKAITTQPDLYLYLLYGLGLIVILDLSVSVTLYRFFRSDRKDMARLSSGLRIVYTLIFGVAAYHLSVNMHPAGLTNETLMHHELMFQKIWSAGLILFGVHLWLIGALMKLHRKIHVVLWVLAMVAGFSYVLVHTLKLAIPESDVVLTLEMSLAFPMAAGELALAIWLIVRGGK